MDLIVEHDDRAWYHSRTISVGTFRRAVQVCKDYNLGRLYWRPATISWPSIGSQPIAVANALIQALERAVQLAHELDYEYPAGEAS